VAEERRRNQQLQESVNDLETELNEERNRCRLSEQRVAILKAQNEKESAQRQRLEQRQNSQNSRPDPNVIQLEQQVEVFKKEVRHLCHGALQ